MDDVANCNEDQPQILHAVVSSGAADETMLLEAATNLEELGPPHVAHFAKLPFPLAVSREHTFVLSTGRSGAKANIRFSHFAPMITGEQRLSYPECVLSPGSESVGTGTQVIAFITLWGRHLTYYDNYLSCITPNGLRNQLLNLSLYGRKRAPAGYAGNTIDAHRFEDEVDRAVALAFHFAIKTFIDNYNIVAPDDLSCPEHDQLAGSFTMLAPGRVSFWRRPEHALAGMMHKRLIPSEVSLDRLEVALRFGRRQFDRYQTRLLAMHRLARDGEAQLAVIGCTTAIEWFLNSLLKEKPIDGWIKSINRLKPSELSVVLPDSLWRRLRSLADQRNDMTHGKPPGRDDADARAANRDASHVIEIGFELYKEVQQQSKVGLLE